MKKIFSILTLLSILMFFLPTHSIIAQTKELPKCLILRENSYTYAENLLLNRFKSLRVNLYQQYLQNYVFSRAENKNQTTPLSKTQESRSDEIYIGNVNSRKFHVPDCWTLPIEKNRVEFSSREEAIDNNYSPCKNCNP